MSEHRITSIEQLEALYGTPVPRSLVKELDHISDHYRSFIEAAPFVVLATCGPEGLDCSPRGDPPGFVSVRDAHTVLLPDRRGNNRIDSLRNIVRDPRVSLLFLIPGVGETLRINGRAAILTEPDLLESFAMQGKPPAAYSRSASTGSTSSARRRWRGHACGTPRRRSRATACPAPAKCWRR